MARIRRVLLRAGAFCVCAAAACGMPRDGEGTLERVRGGVVRVGVVHSPPWASLPGEGEAAGVEPRLVRALAAELGARVEWVPGGEEELLEALEKREVDLVVGGLSDKSPWKPKLGFTRPYYTDSLAVGAAPGAPPPASLNGVRVGVDRARAGARELESRGAEPLPVAELAGFVGPVAAPVWRLAQLERRIGEDVLVQERRVFAVAPGENGWLVRVERFLHARRDSVPALLRREGR